jgi:pimeloyl-ACP methyl ester carboxylesterase
MATVEVRGQKIAYEDTAGDKSALLFSHGFLMDRTMFDHQVSFFKDRYRCIAWDERGFGETVFDDRPFTYWDSGDDAIALLDHLGIDKAVLLGMSQGGFLSMRAAMSHPDRVNGIVLIDSGAHADPPEVLEGYQGLVDRWVNDESLDEVAGIIATIIIDDPRLNPEWITRWKQRDRNSIKLPAQTLLTRDDISGRVDEIKCPVLLVHGENDSAIPIDTAAHLSEQLPNSHGLIRIPGATHASNMTHPQPVNAAIEKFLQEIL